MNTFISLLKSMFVDPVKMPETIGEPPTMEAIAKADRSLDRRVKSANHLCRVLHTGLALISFWMILETTSDWVESEVIRHDAVSLGMAAVGFVAAGLSYILFLAVRSYEGVVVGVVGLLLCIYAGVRHHAPLVMTWSFYCSLLAWWFAYGLLALVELIRQSIESDRAFLAEAPDNVYETLLVFMKEYASIERYIRLMVEQERTLRQFEFTHLNICFQQSVARDCAAKHATTKQQTLSAIHASSLKDETP